MMFSITLLTLFIVYGQSTITSISFDNENNINGKYVNPNVDLVLYLTAEITTSSESISIVIWEDVSYLRDEKVQTFTKSIENGVNKITLTLDSSKYKESKKYYFIINSNEYKSRFYVSSSTCSSTCSVCSSSGTCQCNVPHCDSSTCYPSDECTSCETGYYPNSDGECVDKIPTYGDPTGCNGIYDLVTCYDDGYYTVFSCYSCRTGYKEETIDTCKGDKTYCEKDTNVDCKIDPNCNTCDSSDTSKCLTCNSGFEPNSNGECRVEGSSSPYGDISGCSGSTSTTVCSNERIYGCSSSCKSGYNEVNIYSTCNGVVTYCEKDEDEIICTDSKCTTCTSPSYCTECISGYTAKNGQCIKDEIICTDWPRYFA